MNSSFAKKKYFNFIVLRMKTQRCWFPWAMAQNQQEIHVCDCGQIIMDTFFKCLMTRLEYKNKYFVEVAQPNLTVSDMFVVLLLFQRLQL